MSRRSDQIASLVHVRGVLEAYLEGLDDEGLRWRALPDAMPIGELVLHVVAFEYLTIAALVCRARNDWNRDLWESVAGGFARAAGFRPPGSIGRSELADTLAAVRVETLRHLNCADFALRVSGLAEAVAALATELRALGLPGDYDELARSYGRSLRDDSSPDADGKVSVVRLLEQHESYHRGQITFAGYLHARAPR